MSEVLTTSHSPTLADVVAPQSIDPKTDAVVTPEVQKEEPLSARFAALARKQKQVDATLAKAKASESELAEYRKWKEDQAAAATAPKVRKNPIEALMAEGWSYADASAYVMNDEKPTPDQMVKEVETKLEKYIREQKEAKEKEQSEAEAEALAAQQKQIGTFKTKIGNEITADKEKYEITNMMLEREEIEEQIYALMDAHYEDTKAKGEPKILSIPEAADLLEAYLVDKAEKALKANKFKPKTPEPETTQKSGALSFTTKTLSNTSTPTVPTVRPPAKNDDERTQRALALIG